MTLEEACLYLGISPDAEDLDIDQIEKNYRTKISIYDTRRFNPDSPEYREARRMRENIEQAYDCLLEAYEDLYGDEETEDEEIVPSPVKKNNNLLLKLTLIMTTITSICLAGFIYFTMKPDKAKDYEKILRELESLKIDLPVQNNIAPDYADLVEKVMPSIVLVKTDTGTGSGFFVSSAGDILTNYHVIDDAKFISVIPSNGKSYNALVKDYDAKRDMALLTINSPYPVKFLKISATLPRQGEAVIAIGNPKGLSGTVSNGIVSAFRENNTWVQFTAPISQGSSGGALINLKGEVVGMPTKLRTDGQNLNFAIAPGVLTKFFDAAQNKTPKNLTKKPNSNFHVQVEFDEDYNGLDGMIFVRSDKEYDVYLETEYIEYDKTNELAAFYTIWFPTERTKRQMKRDKNFNAKPGKEFGPCLLSYIVDLDEGKYMHVRTVNFYTDGTIARDYAKPMKQYRWEVPTKKSRIEDLMMTLKDYLNKR